MADSRTYDLIVIGSGPGGYTAAIRGAQLGLKSAIVEVSSVGGRCLNEACIPAKAVLRVADFWDEVGDAKQFGVEITDPKLDWAGVAKRRDRVIKTMVGGVGGLLKRNGVDLFEGRGTLVDNTTIKIAGETERTLSAAKVVLATGSVPLPIPGVEFGERVLDTAATWLGNIQPQRLAVIGAGASGVEVASAYARLGTEVVLLEALDRVLPTEDDEISAHVARELGKQGIAVCTGVQIEHIEATSGGVELRWSDASAVFDYLCIAAGRGADIEQLGLNAAGLRLNDAGKIEVDSRMRTACENIYAIGDLTPGPALAHKASEEAVIAAEDAAGLETTPLEFAEIPKVTFCYPQVASVGSTETEAMAELGTERITVGRFPYSAIGAATVYGDRGGFIKLVADAGSGEILGAHIVGARAADLIAELAVARRAEDTYESLARTIHAHPTLSEGVMEAARDAAGWAING